VSDKRRLDSGDDRHDVHGDVQSRCDEASRGGASGRALRRGDELELGPDPRGQLDRDKPDPPVVTVTDMAGAGDGQRVDR
jgi:hypothetical protein